MIFLFAIVVGFIGALILFIIGAVKGLKTKDKWGFKSVGEGIGGFFKIWFFITIAIFVLGILIICVGESYG